MKKVVCLLLIAFLLTSCKEQNSEISISQNGIWISCYELSEMLQSEDGFESEWETVIKNCKDLKIGNLYIHTRAFGDSLYRSDYFPLMKSVKNYDYDVFEFIVKECKKANLKVHAWINPYRISTSTVNIDEIDSQSPAYKWLKDSDVTNDGNICFFDGIYLNPARPQVRALVIDGIRELVAKYDIDGIHFDDYFYPTSNESFDSADYKQYQKNSGSALSLSDWRRLNVSTLISSCHTALKFADEKLIFSISPAASLEHNFEDLYADVGEWIENGYIDEIIPQLYFGFEYPDQSFQFPNLLEEWKALANKNPDVKLKIGLASYKAKPSLEADKAEWESNYDIIARQAELCENDSEIGGYVLFSYSSVFGDDVEYTNQREKLKEYLNQGENK